jgi:diguanylate cyclase (GGDEF)-like protein
MNYLYLNPSIFKKSPIEICIYDDNCKIIEYIGIHSSLKDEESFVLNNEFEKIKYPFLRNVLINRKKLVGKALLEWIQLELEENFEFNSGKIYIKQFFVPFIDQNSGKKGVIRYGIDLSKNRNNENELHYLANHDELTKLPNRRFLKEEFHNLLNHLIDKETMAALILLDLDRFKEINDTLGHDIGDDLIVSVSRRLQKLFEKNENAIVCRYGGDEFVIFISQILSEEEIYLISNDIVLLFQNPFQLGEHNLFVTTSLGINYFNFSKNFTKLDECIKKADIAMYNSKEMGRNRFSIYNPSMESKTANQFKMETILYDAYQNKRFIIFYQPKIDSKSKRIIGLEALLRLKYNDTYYLPQFFIKAAEDSGLIKKIGYLMFKEICIFIKKLLQHHISITVGINLSEKQFYDTYLVPQLEYALEKHGIEGKHVELEIQESIVMKNIDKSVKIIDQLRSKGILVTLDNFGSGSSSLSKLKQCPINNINIDKTFIENITESYQDEAITSAIVNMANKLGILVTLEGIETKDQLMLVKNFECDMMQGYIFEKPMLENEMEEILKENKEYSHYFNN